MEVFVVTLHHKKDSLQEGRLQEQMVTSQGELVKGQSEDEISAKEMAASQQQIKNNPFKTPPNNLTNKNDRKMGMGEKG